MNADPGCGIAWGASAVVFARASALWVVPSEGGEPRPLTTLDAIRREVLHMGQIVLPGGRTVLFSSLASEPGTERIEAVSIDGGPRTVVIERATTPIWSPTGHLLFTTDGAVLAVAFDATAVKAQGDATPIIPSGQVSTAGGSPMLQLSRNGTLLFAPQNFQANRLVSVARDGSALTFDLPPGPYATPRISQDERRIMFVIGGSQLEAWSPKTRTRERLAAAAPGTNFPIWNRDGTRIFFRRFNLLFWASADGTRQGLVPAGLANEYPSGPGPDPDTFFVTRIQPETEGDVFLLSSSGAFKPRPLISTPAYEGGAQLSPDGRWLVYVSVESNRSAIQVRRYPALDRQWQVSEGSGIQPRWSAGSREIYYRDGAHIMAVPFDGSRDVPVIGKATALFKDEYDVGYGITIANYDVTGDGRFLMLRRDAQGGNFRLILNWTEELKQILAKGGVR